MGYTLEAAPDLPATLLDHTASSLVRPQCSDTFTCGGIGGRSDCNAGIHMIYSGVNARRGFTLGGTLNVLSERADVFLDARSGPGYTLLRGRHTFTLRYTCTGTNTWVVATTIDGLPQTTVGSDLLGTCSNTEFRYVVRVANGVVAFGRICRK